MRIRALLEEKRPFRRALLTGALLLICYGVVTLPLEWHALLSSGGRNRTTSQTLELLQALAAGQPVRDEHRLLVFLAGELATLAAALLVAAAALLVSSKEEQTTRGARFLVVLAGAFVMLSLPAHLPFLLPHVKEFRPNGTVLTQAEYSRAWRDAITQVWSVVLLLAIPVLASGRIPLRFKLVVTMLAGLAVLTAYLPHVEHRGSRTDNELVIFGAALLTVLYLGHQVYVSLRHESQMRRKTEAALDTAREERRRYEEQSQAAVAALGAMQRRLTLREDGRANFLAAAAHDLRHPLTSAVIYADLAIMEMKALHAGHGAALGHLDVLRAEIGALARAFDAILDYSYLETGRVTAHPQPCRLCDIFGELDRRFAPLAHRRNLDLSFVYPSEGCVVETDPGLLTRVLSNLLSNAIKCTPAHLSTRSAKGRHDIFVRARQQGLMSTVYVADRGPGIPDDKLDAIFDAGVQLDNHQRERNEGFGLGLATVRSIVARALTDHTVRVHSIVGRGTHFMVDVPLLFLAAPAPVLSEGRDMDPDALGAKSLDGALVAVVEDDASLRRGLTTLIRSAGAYVVDEGSLKDMATRLSEADRLPDILLTDDRLPGGKTGADAIDMVRAACFGRQIPALVLTADGDAAAEALRDKPFVVVLRKPVDAPVLIARLATHYRPRPSPLEDLTIASSSNAMPARATS